MKMGESLSKARDVGGVPPIDEFGQFVAMSDKIALRAIFDQ